MEESPEIRDIIIGRFDAVANGDASWGDRHLSQKILVVGTDPEEWLDYEQAASELKAEAQELGGKVTISMGRAEGFREGSVGWGIAHPTVTLPNGKSFSVRWAAVFHQEDGQWKAVQIHSSVGVRNEDLLG
jgi:SnoaL-like domain